MRLRHLLPPGENGDKRLKSRPKSPLPSAGEGAERERGDHEAARALLEQGLATRRRLHGERHSSVALSLQGLGGLHFFEGRLDLARSLLREALDIYTAALPENHRSVAEARLDLGVELRAEPSELGERPLRFRGLARPR